VQLALTDSYLSTPSDLTTEQQQFLKTRAVHYRASSLPLGEKLCSDFPSALFPEVSAGHAKHEYTTGTAWPLIMKQFEQQEEFKWTD
jgi:hypothetical protein